jgi:hypothetical protein
VGLLAFSRFLNKRFSSPCEPLVNFQNPGKVGFGSYSSVLLASMEEISRGPHSTIPELLIVYMTGAESERISVM